VVPAGEPPAASPPEWRATADPVSSPAAELKALALERRLVEERAARERTEQELAAAREQIAALTEHHASAAERAREVVRLEGEVTAAKQRAERAEAALAKRPNSTKDVQRLEAELAAARQDLAEVREPLELSPLPSRFDARRRGRETGTRVAAVVLVLILLGAFVLLLSLL
jgi:hypothetical protein